MQSTQLDRVSPWLIRIPLVLFISLLSGLALYALYLHHDYAGREAAPLELRIFGQDAASPGLEASFRVSVVASKSGEPVADQRVALTLGPRPFARPGERNVDKYVAWAALPLVSLGEVATNAGGLATFTQRLPGDLPEGAYVLSARAEGTAPWDQVKADVWVTRPIETVIATDKPTYQPGQTLFVRTLSTYALSGAPITRGEIEILIEDGERHTVLKRSLPISAYGGASLELPIDAEPVTGDWTITARLGGSPGKSHAVQHVTVERYELPPFEVEILPERGWLRPGQPLEVGVSARYVWGMALEDAQVEARLLPLEAWGEGRALATARGRLGAQGEGRVALTLSEAQASALWEEARARYEKERWQHERWRYGLPTEEVWRLSRRGEGEWVSGREVPELPEAAPPPTLRLQVRVTDGSGASQLRALDVPLWEADLALEFVDSGPLIAGRPQALFARASTPDGAPAEALVTLEPGGHVSPTGSDGIAAFEVLLPEGITEVRATARGAGEGVEARASLVAAPGALRLTLEGERRPARGALPITITSGVDGIVLVDLVRSGRSLWQGEVTLHKGVGALSIPLGEGARGRVEVHAYRLREAGAPGDNTLLSQHPGRWVGAVFNVERDDGLTLELLPDKATYRPGGVAEVGVRVRRSGAPAGPVALALAAVDEAVFARLSEDAEGPSAPEGGLQYGTVVTQGPSQRNRFSRLREALWDWRRVLAARVTVIPILLHALSLWLLGLLTLLTLVRAPRPPTEGPRMVAPERAWLVALRRVHWQGFAACLLLGLAGGGLALDFKHPAVHLGDLFPIVVGARVPRSGAAALVMIFGVGGVAAIGALRVALIVFRRRGATAEHEGAGGHPLIPAQAWLSLFAHVGLLGLLGWILVGSAEGLDRSLSDLRALYPLALWGYLALASLLSIHSAMFHRPRQANTEGASLDLPASERLALRARLGAVIHRIWLLPLWPALGGALALGFIEGYGMPKLSADLRAGILLAIALAVIIAQGVTLLPLGAFWRRARDHGLPTLGAAVGLVGLNLGVAMAYLPGALYFREDLIYSFRAEIFVIEVVVSVVMTFWQAHLLTRLQESLLPSPGMVPLAWSWLKGALMATPLALSLVGAAALVVSEDGRGIRDKMWTPSRVRAFAAVGTAPGTPPGESASESVGAVAPGGGEAEAVRVRAFFPETLMWKPHVITDPEGRVQVSIPLADSITDWRLSAQAIDAQGHRGSATGTLPVVQPFFIDLRMPPSLTRGDVVHLPLTAFNHTGEALSVTVRVDPAPGLALAGPLPGPILLDPRVRRTVWLPIEATEAGERALTVRASAGDVADGITRPVTVRYEGRAVSLSAGGLVEGEATHTLNIPEAIVPGSLTLSLRAFPSLSAIAQGSLAAMLREPNGCFEQTTSVNWPNVLILDALKRQKGAGDEDSEGDEDIVAEFMAGKPIRRAENFAAKGYQRLVRFQEPGGGFSPYGNGGPRRHLTAWALLQLSDMHAVYPVDVGVLREAARWLLQERRSFKGDGRPSLAEDARSLGGLAAVRGLLGPPPSGLSAMNGLLRHPLEGIEALTQDVSKGCQAAAEGAGAHGLALCANALIAAGEGAAAAPLLERLEALAQRDFEGAFWSDPGRSVFGAYGPTLNTETTALAVQALLLGAGDGHLAYAGAQWLLAELRPRGGWGTTQATVQALRALRAWDAAAGSLGEAALVVRVDGVEAGRLSSSGEPKSGAHALDLSPFARPGPLQVEVDVGPGRRALYQVVAEFHMPWDAPLEASEGFAPPKGPMTLQVDCGSGQARVGETLRCEVEAEVVRAVENPLLRIGIPPGAEPDALALKALVDQNEVAQYEIGEGEVILYMDGLHPKAPLRFMLPLRATMPIEALSRPSTFYPYYQPEAVAEVEPLRFTVTGRGP